MALARERSIFCTLYTLHLYEWGRQEGHILDEDKSYSRLFHKVSGAEELDTPYPISQLRLQSLRPAFSARGQLWCVKPFCLRVGKFTGRSLKIFLQGVDRLLNCLDFIFCKAFPISFQALNDLEVVCCFRWKDYLCSHYDSSNFGVCYHSLHYISARSHRCKITERWLCA